MQDPTRNMLNQIVHLVFPDHLVEIIKNVMPQDYDTYQQYKEGQQLTDQTVVSLIHRLHSVIQLKTDQLSQ